MSEHLVSPKSIRKVTLVDVDGTVTVLQERKGGKKKSQSMLLKPIERVQRRMAEALKDGAAEYLDRHEKSNSRKRDGWVRDMGKNTAGANRKMMRTARKMLPGS